MFRFDCNDKGDEDLTREREQRSIGLMEKLLRNQDQVLLGRQGPIWLIRQHGEDVGIEISQSGRMSEWEDLFAAADALVRTGLLHPARRNGTPKTYYAFTERGKIAHWALEEDRLAKLSAYYHRMAPEPEWELP